MPRRIAILLLGLGLVGLVAAPAGAAEGTPKPRPFSGTTSYTFGTDGCSFVHQVYDGTFRTRHHRTGSFHLDGCVTLANPFPYSGTFTMARNRGTLSGTVAGTISSVNGSTCEAFHFVLTINGGTRHLRHATGTVVVDGTWCSQGEIPAVNDPIDGTITASIHR